MKTRSLDLPRLGSDPESPFPDPLHARHPEGLVAWGGDLSLPRLLNAYRKGIFPWFEPESIMLWWSPDPRAVMIPGRTRLSRRLRRELRNGSHTFTVDRAFEQVIRRCGAERADQEGTWITPEMIDAYCALHRAGHAHSVEVWHGDELTGGIYGVALGKLFFAESKFHGRSNASKLALAGLLRCLESWEFLALDCQIWNPHLERLGVRLLGREDFCHLTRYATAQPDPVGSWSERASGVDFRDW